MKRFVAIFVVLLTVPLWAQEGACDYRYKASSLAKYEQAVAAYDAKHYSECAALLRKLAAKEPKSPDVCFYQGMLAVRQGEKPGAIRRHFTKLFSLCADYPNALAHYYMGVVNYSDDHFEEAVANFNRYFELANQQGGAESDAVYEEASNYLSWSQFLADAYSNQAPFNPKVMLGASSREDELMPYLTIDGSQLYYIRMVPEDNSRTFYAREQGKRVPRICVSQRKDSTFTEGVELQEPFNVNKGEGGITMTADNKTLFYSVLRQNRNGYSNVDVFTTTCRDGVWAPIQSVGDNVNGEKYWDSQPSVTPDGQYLYFASNRPGGMGGTDIWRCRRLPNGDWSRAENLGSSVNSPGNEKSPFIHADGHTLYFASNGWQGLGGYDMFFININDTYMQRPTNMGLPINTDNDDICFGVVADGSKAYYAGRPVDVPSVGGSDIFFFELYPAAQPESMRYFKGRLVGENGKRLGGTIRVCRPTADDALYQVDSTDGTYAIVLSQKEENLIVMYSEGYMPQVLVGTAAQLRQQGEQKIVAPLLRLVRPNSRYPLPVNPKNGSLSNTDKRVLDAYVRFLIDHPRLHVRVEAAAANNAEAIYRYLLDQKLRPERIAYHYGSEVSAPQIMIVE